MKYEKLFKGYKFFFSFVPLQAILFVKSSYTVHKEMYRSLLNFFSKNAVLKTIVIPLSTVFTGISTASLIESPKCVAYLRTALI